MSVYAVRNESTNSEVHDLLIPKPFFIYTLQSFTWWLKAKILPPLIYQFSIRRFKLFFQKQLTVKVVHATGVLAPDSHTLHSEYRSWSPLRRCACVVLGRSPSGLDRVDDRSRRPRAPSARLWSGPRTPVGPRPSIARVANGIHFRSGSGGGVTSRVDRKCRGGSVRRRVTDKRRERVTATTKHGIESAPANAVNSRTAVDNNNHRSTVIYAQLAHIHCWFARQWQCNDGRSLRRRRSFSSRSTRSRYLLVMGLQQRRRLFVYDVPRQLAPVQRINVFKPKTLVPGGKESATSWSGAV